MANLDNKRIKDTYEGLIKTNDNNAISSEVELTDGAGNGTGVSVSTDGRVVASGTVSFGSLKDTGENITITKFVDEADGIANNDNDTSIPTVAAVKDYVDSTELDTVTSVNTQTGDVILDTDDISEGTSNQYYTEARVSANTSVAANTLKNTYPSADATKVGHITITQDVDLDTLESNVATNNAKISFDSTSSTKLAGIESGAEVNPTSTDELSEGSTNLYYTDARVSANSAVAANTAKTGITTQQAADITTNNAKVGITTTQANAITTNSTKVSFPEAPNDGDSYVRKNEGWESLTHPTDAVTSVNGETGVVVLDSDDITEGTSNLYFTDARVSANSDVTANTAKVGITTQQASDITTNNAKVGITTQQAADIVTNNSKVGITTQQASDITTNNAKVGITTAQADAITANTAKNSYPTADATKLSGIEAGAEVNVQANWNETDTGSDAFILNKPTIPTAAVDSVNTQTGDVVLDTDDISEGSTNLYYTESRVSANTNVAANTAKVGITTEQANAITANTAKVGITTQQASDITTNNAKVGITTQQASDITTNNAKVGITTTQANNITTNNAKISFDSTSSTKLAGIEAGAEVNTVDSVNGQTGVVSLSTTNVSEGTNLYYLDSRVSTNSEVVANTAKISYNTTDSTKVGYISITQAVDLDVVENKQENQYKIIGVAMDYSNRVLSDNGTAEGTQSIMENIETLILN